MKKIRFILIAAALIMTLVLSGCDIILGSIPDTDTGTGGTETDNGTNNGTNNGSNNGTNNGTNNGSNNGTNNGTGNGSGDGGNTDGNGSGNTTHTHEYLLESTVDSTCEVKGKKIFKCECGDGTEEELPLGEHTEQTLPATESLTEGKKCSVCGVVLVKQKPIFSSSFTTPSKYDGDYAYEYLETLNNGEKLRELYILMDNAADDFHVGVTACDEEGVVAKIKYGDLGLTVDEALAVFSAYQMDRPLYYWISKTVRYVSSTGEIYIICDEEYRDNGERASLNAKIYGVAESFVGEISTDSEYIIALTLHDLIISLGDYAYLSDGVTPSDESSAHNIIGLIDKGEGVCESYAKTFQLLLNFLDVENIFVSGYAGEAHAWNMAKLDDGEWYWFDLTWDDTPEFAGGISYRYFAVNDTELLMNLDGPWTTAATTFAAKHIPYEKLDTGINFNYTIPNRSSTEFSASEVLLRDVFTVGDFTYAISGYKSVCLTDINVAGAVVIPETVSYLGNSYTVTSIGVIRDGLFKTGSLVADHYTPYGDLTLKITSIDIPASVTLIWDDAFNIHSLTDINVAEGNKVYASVDGVLYTKDLSVLVKYPSGRDDTSYTLNENCKAIAAGAFSMYFSNMEMTLETLVIPDGVITAGIAHYGYGYGDSSHGNSVSGEWSNILKFLSGDGSIVTRSGDEYIPAA